MIDLSKIRAFTLPHEEKEIEICGEKQTIDIWVMRDTTAIRFVGLDTANNAEDRLKAVIIALAETLRISEEDAKILCDNDFKAANEIVSLGQKITKEYHEKVNTEKKSAEKNSETEQAVNTQG